MKRILVFLLCSMTLCFAMENYIEQEVEKIIETNPGDNVSLKPDQALVSFMNLSERPQVGDMVIFKTYPDKYTWARVHEVLGSSKLTSDNGTLLDVERYVLIHAESNGKKTGSRHLTSALYKIKD